MSSKRGTNAKAKKHIVSPFIMRHADYYFAGRVLSARPSPGERLERLDIIKRKNILFFLFNYV